MCSVSVPEGIGMYLPEEFLNTPSGTVVKPDQRAILALVQTSSLYFLSTVVPTGLIPRKIFVLKVIFHGAAWHPKVLQRKE